jgi:iron-sulfur cluster assembly accessory protein
MDAVTFSVTDRAAERIARILKGEVPESVLRVSVEGGGCSGFQYRFEVERGGTPEDLVIERSGATVVIDPISTSWTT